MIDKTLLVIDDDADLLQLVSVLLSNSGARVFTARDGLEGLTKMFTYLNFAQTRGRMQPPD